MDSLRSVRCGLGWTTFLRGLDASTTTYLLSQKVALPMVRYSQEMTNLVYFKIERTDPVITRLRGRRYHRTYGIVLSSFRVVEVLVPLNLHGQIPLDRGKYVYFTKCSNQWTIVRKLYRVCEIHDVECLEKVTSKKSTR
ncbi:MAG: hypothetical protein QW772_04100, partial [Zestosphaera sp.]